MATAPSRKKLDLRGVSQDALTQARDSFEALTPVVELPIRGGKTARFELVVVKAADIDTLTFVASENARNQTMLNPVSVSDIDPLIALNGQQYPAFGQRNESTGGMIKVMDGSRRRYSCKRNNKDYYIYVTADPITKADIRYLSNTANISKPLSLYEKGALFAELLNDGEYPDAKALAAAEGEHESTVSIALAAYREIPATIATSIPSISDLGRTLIKQITDMLTDKRLSAEKQTELSQATKDGKYELDTLISATGSTDPAKLNAAFVALLRSDYLQLLPKAPAKMPPAIIASKGNTKAVITKSSKSGFSVQFDCTDEKTRTAIEAAILKVIEGK